MARGAGVAERAERAREAWQWLKGHRWKGGQGEQGGLAVTEKGALEAGLAVAVGWAVGARRMKTVAKGMSGTASPLMPRCSCLA
eukprot:1148609-Pelagomonas_calceolata.AAC.5